MQISESDIQNTVFELFATRGLAEGDAMLLTRLEQFWTETRLRRSDLVSGIAQLCSQGLLNIEELDGETSLSLTAAGNQRAAGVLSAGVGYWGRYLQKEVLPAMRVVAQPERPDGQGRRDYEGDSSSGIPWTRN